MMNSRPAIAEAYVFVSYASADRDRVMPVVEALRRAGVPVWLDQQSIAGGENYAREIVEGIRGCAALVLLCSSASLASRNVKQEVGVAWKHERPYLPLLLEPVAIPDDLSYFLEMAQWIEVLDKHESEWLPQVITALAPLGIAPKPGTHEEMHLAGRERELALLREKLAAAKGRKGGLVLIGGEAGIGKTTLAEAVLRDARRQGFVVLEGHCFDLAETPPYGPWIDLFLHLPDAPGMPSLPPAFAERGTVGAVSSPMMLFAQVDDFLAALSRRCTVVVLIDDFHLSDSASLDLFRYLSRSIAALPLLIIATYRTEELTRGHPLYPMLPQLARETASARIDLGRLDDHAVRALVAERYHLPDADTDRLVSHLQARAEGNAFFLGELLRSLMETGSLRQENGQWLLGGLDGTRVPSLLRQIIDARVARLDVRSQELLAIAAVVGLTVPLSVWAVAAGADEDALLDAVARAETAHMMVETDDGAGATFAHALVREALYAGIRPSQRRGLHRAIGGALAALPHPDPDVVAGHFQHAGDSRMVEWLIKAGERAQRAHARGMAVERYVAAVAALDQGDASASRRAMLFRRLGYARQGIDPRQGILDVEQAARLATEAGSVSLMAAIIFDRGFLRCQAGDIRPGLVEMQAGMEALEALPAVERIKLATQAYPYETPDEFYARRLLVQWLAYVGRFSEALALGESLIAQATTAARSPSGPGRAPP